MSEETVLIEGKTKVIIDAGNGTVLVKSKDDITAGDGLKHDVLSGKAACSTEHTCNVFELLETAGVPTHFVERVDERTFRARKVRMVPLELIARRITTGSYLKRYPGAKDGTVLDDILFEIFEKDDTLSPPEAGDDTMNDPFTVFDFESGVMRRWKPKQPIDEGFIDERTLSETPFADITPEFVEELRRLTVRIFSILEEAWAKQGGVLFDFKIEVGIDVETGELVLADVLDGDSCRIRFEGEDRSKESYRDGSKTLAQIKKDYIEVAELTRAFVDA